jgi:proteasome lid subunit RPN8/RPN11
LSDAWRLTAAARTAIEAEALRAFPEEGCGFLVGDPWRSLIDEARPRPNVHPGPRATRFLIEGLEYVRLEDELADGRRGLVGVFHSHPLHPPVPSETDRAAAWPGLVYVIQEVHDGRHPGDLRAWRLRPGRDGYDPLRLDPG